MFTMTDKSLLDRAALRTTVAANCIKSCHPIWGATADSKKAKREYDRLMRDAHDMRALAKRMVPPKPKAVVQPELPMTARSE